LRAFKLALAAVIALSAVLPAHADPLGPKMRPSGSPSGVARDGNSGPRPTVPAGGSGDWHPNPGHSSQWGEDWGRLRSTPNHLYGFWAPPEAWGVPYIGWVVPFVPSLLRRLGRALGCSSVTAVVKPWRVIRNRRIIRRRRRHVRIDRRQHGGIDWWRIGWGIRWRRCVIRRRT